MAQTWKSIKAAIERAGVKDDTKISYIILENTCCEDDDVKITEELDSEHGIGINDA